MSAAPEPLPLVPLPEQVRVSVVIACYNYQAFLVDCLDSCLAQTRPPDEVVVVDDGSTDGSWDTMQQYAARHPQVRPIRQLNGGVCDATNKALDACTGDVVLLLDADDRMAPTRVQQVLQALRTPIGPHLPGWVHHALQRFSATHANLGATPYYHPSRRPHGYLAERMLASGTSPVATMTSGLAFRRELLDVLLPLDAHRANVQDVQLWMGAPLLSPVAWIDEPLSFYRMHGQSDSFGGMLSSLPKVRLTRERAERFHRWFMARMLTLRPQVAARWRPLQDDPGYQWLQFLERWLAGQGKDRILAWRVLAQSRQAPLQQRVYLFSGWLLPRPAFLALSRLLFGASPLKVRLRRLVGRP